LVLTSPKKFFLDLRFTKPLPSPNSDGQAILEWGFAGYSKRDGPKARWIHLVDSRYDDPPVDAGVTEDLENGDVLETGEMLNWEKGEIGAYEELWRDFEVVPKIAVVWVLDGENGDGKTLGAEQLRIRGAIVRVGEWCQGIVKIDGKVTAERWLLEESAWKRVCKVGHAELPFSSLVFSEGPGVTGEGFPEGEKATGGLKWRMIERSAW
jgi:hypothetical protein